MNCSAHTSTKTFFKKQLSLEQPLFLNLIRFKCYTYHLDLYLYRFDYNYNFSSMHLDKNPVIPKNSYVNLKYCYKSE